MQTKRIIYLVAVLSCIGLPHVLAQKAGQDSAKPVFYDDFEYDVARSAKNAEVAFRAHGWSDVKANNSYFRRGAGYLYTKLDPVRNSRVLVMESLPSTVPTPPGFRAGQTDYWLKFGSGEAPLTTIPANVWFQFWTYATPESRFAWRDKTLYPCRGPYPCSRRDGRTDYVWLFMWGSGGYETVAAPPGGRFLALHATHADFRGDPEYPTNKEKLFQNLKRIPLLAGRWYQVRIHIDISKEQGVYEVWIRQKDQPWEKVAEWIGGVTKNFSWPIPANERVGFRVLAMPTTVNGPGDSTTYMDDFTIATSEVVLERNAFALPVPAVIGDLDGDGAVRIVDAQVALHIAVGLSQPSQQQLPAGDLNGDGKITVADVMSILRAALGQEAL